MSEQEKIIYEFLEKCNFENDNLTTCCSICYKQDDKCICVNNREIMMNKVQYIYESLHDKDVSNKYSL